MYTKCKNINVLILCFIYIWHNMLTDLSYIMWYWHNARTEWIHIIILYIILCRQKAMIYWHWVITTPCSPGLNKHEIIKCWHITWIFHHTVKFHGNLYFFYLMGFWHHVFNIWQNVKIYSQRVMDFDIPRWFLDIIYF